MKAEFNEVDKRDRMYLIDGITDALSHHDAPKKLVEDICQVFRDNEFGWVEIEKHYDDPEGDYVNYSRL